MRIYTLTEKLQNFSILSRIIIISLQVVANFLIPDHEAEAFISPPDPNLTHRWGDSIINFLFKGMIRWDAQYFIHIAQYGYSHENTLAFFPLFPMLVRGIGTVLYLPLQIFCNYYSCLIIGAIALNFFLFVKTTVIIFQLSNEVLRNEVLAYRSALLFCVNPASIFFTAPYSESLYAFLLFSSLLACERKSTFSPIRFSLASAVRSNGLVNIGFLLYHKLQDGAIYFYRIHNAVTESGRLSLIIVVILTFNYTLIPMTLGCLLVLIPFALFQFWCYHVYCQEEGTNSFVPPHLELYLRANFLHSPELGEAEWCYNVPPIAYSHIQEKYWEVGMFKYYEIKQIPNFILALPVVMTVICHASLYMVDNAQVCLSLGIPPNAEKIKKDSISTAWLKDGINSWRVFIYTAHSLALCVFCVLCIHVQVTTRLLCSSSPIIYWFAAYLISDGSNVVRKDSTTLSLKIPVLLPEQKNKQEGRAESLPNLNKMFKVSLFAEFPKSFWGQVVLSYFAFYFIIGTVLFSNFLPWT